MRSYEDFREAMENFCIDAFGVIPEEVQRGDHFKKLWEKLSLQEYANRLYILTKEDALNIAEENNIGLDVKNLTDEFWKDVDEIFDNWPLDWVAGLLEAVEEAVKRHPESIKIKGMDLFYY